MTGFSCENNNGSYELTIDKDYTGNETEIQEFAEEYWNTPKDITVYIGGGVVLKKVVDDLRSWMMHKGIERYIPKEKIEPGDVRAKDWENRYQLLHITTHVVTGNMKIKVR